TGMGAEGEVMRIRIGAALLGVVFQLAASSLTVVGGANQALAQAPQPPPAAQPAIPPITTEPVTPPQLLPDGGFPAYVPAPAGNIPARAPWPPPGLLSPVLEPPISDYPPPGIYPGEPEHSPQWLEFFHPISPPLPDYYYLPSYYNTPGIGARPLADYAPVG